MSSREPNFNGFNDDSDRFMMTMENSECDDDDEELEAMMMRLPMILTDVMKL